MANETQVKQLLELAEDCTKTPINQLITTQIGEQSTSRALGRNWIERSICSISSNCYLRACCLTT